MGGFDKEEEEVARVGRAVVGVHDDRASRNGGALGLLDGYCVGNGLTPPPVLYDLPPPALLVEAVRRPAEWLEDDTGGSGRI